MLVTVSLGSGECTSVTLTTSAPRVYSRPAFPIEWHQQKGVRGMPDVPEVRFLTVAEVAELMRVSKMTVYRLVHSGELPAIRFGRSYRVPETAVADALQRPISDAG